MVSFVEPVPVEEEDALAVTVEEEAALGLENMVAVVVVLVATVEEEGAVAAWVVADVWLVAPKSSTRRLLVRLLTFARHVF